MKTQKKSSRWLGWLALGAVVVLGAGLFTRAALARSNEAAPAGETAQVTQIDARTTVEASGALQPLQTASLTWKTSGQVDSVNVSAGQTVAAGQVLLSLAPNSAPQNVIQAQSELLTAQEALDDLLHPSALSLANAEKAVADAASALDKAERNLRNLTQPDLSNYQQAVTDAQTAVRQAQQNLEITNIGDSQKAVSNAQSALDSAQTRLNDLKNQDAQYPGCCTSRLDEAQKSYDQAVDNLRVAQLRLEQAQTNTNTSVTNAQDKLVTAQANLRAAQAAPDALKLAQSQAEVSLAQAKLSSAQDTLHTLQTEPAANDVAKARARVEAAQVTLDTLRLTAPFAGEVAQVNQLPGDLAAQNSAALVLVNRSQTYVDLAVDETDVVGLSLGDPVELTFDPLPQVRLTGQVSQIATLGQVSQGLVRYTVRVSLTELDPAVRLGMTANASIITAVQTGALAVPFTAVQSDAQGEFVQRLNAGAIERVAITSGQTQGDLLVVSGNLTPGDTLVIPAVVVKPAASGPFGGMGGGN